METVLRQFLDKYLILSNDEIAMINEQLLVRQFPKRAMLIREGEKEQFINLVTKGILRKYFYKGNQEIITQLADEGTLISSSVSFLAQNPSQYYVEALEAVTVLSISKDTLDKLYVKMPKMERLGRL